MQGSWRKGGRVDLLQITFLLVKINRHCHVKHWEWSLMTICVHNITITKDLKKSVNGSGKEVIVSQGIWTVSAIWTVSTVSVVLVTSGCIALRVSYFVDFVGFPIRDRQMGEHFGQNGQKLRETYKINIFGQNHGLGDVGKTSEFFGLWGRYHLPGEALLCVSLIMFYISCVQSRRIIFKNLILLFWFCGICTRFFRSTGLIYSGLKTNVASGVFMTCCVLFHMLL